MTPRERVLAAMGELGTDENEILAVIAERLVGGRGVYGEWSAANDQRDHVREAAEELLDCSVYLAMDVLRRRAQ